MREFGSVGDALAAAPSTLADAIGAEPAQQLRDFKTLADAVLAERVGARQWVSIDEMAQFLNFTIGFSPVELFYAFYLDSAGSVIRSEVVARGGVAYAQVSARELIVRAVQLGSASLVIAHNHPSGAVCPSRRDAEFTARVERMAGDFEMRLIDHIIVSRGNAWSIKRRQRIWVGETERRLGM